MGRESDWITKQDLTQLHLGVESAILIRHTFPVKSHFGEPATLFDSGLRQEKTASTPSVN
jgi:hypothetical protein